MQTNAPEAQEWELFHRGEGARAHELLGAHPAGTGWRFAVWAPHAQRVSLVGDFNGWDPEADAMRARPDGVWEAELPAARLADGAESYQFAVLGSDGAWHRRADPFGQRMAAGGVSRLSRSEPFAWQDGAWMAGRAEKQAPDQPLNAYEVHLSSWRRGADGALPEPGALAEQLAAHVRKLGFTHVSLLPVMEPAREDTWGYDTLGYFAASERLGGAQGLRTLVDTLHREGVGVILDWTPAHFPHGEAGLRRFDGEPLYEYADPRRGELPMREGCLFDLSRGEVRSFLLSSACFWLEAFHADGLRLDVVSSMVLNDFGREGGGWLPNRNGGRECLEGIDFLQRLNALVHERFPGALMIAEESRVFPGVTHSPGVGGLGFDLKWNTGWAHDTLAYLREEPERRGAAHDKLTFSLCYAFDERFLLPLSHDEAAVDSLLDRQPGDLWRKFAGMRALWGCALAHPGKKLLFMGGEFGQFTPWRWDDQLDWFLLEYDMHPQLMDCVGELNRLYRETPALWQQDGSWDGFQWLLPDDRDGSVLAFLRWARDGSALLCVTNFKPDFHPVYRVGFPSAGRLTELINTDSALWGGSDQRCGDRQVQPAGWHGFPWSAELTVPPLATVWYRYDPE